MPTAPYYFLHGLDQCGNTECHFGLSAPVRPQSVQEPACRCETAAPFALFGRPTAHAWQHSNSEGRPHTLAYPVTLSQSPAVSKSQPLMHSLDGSSLPFHSAAPDQHVLASPTVHCMPSCHLTNTGNVSTKDAKACLSDSYIAVGQHPSGDYLLSPLTLTVTRPPSPQVSCVKSIIPSSMTCEQTSCLTSQEFVALPSSLSTCYHGTEIKQSSQKDSQSLSSPPFTYPTRTPPPQSLLPLSNLLGLSLTLPRPAPLPSGSLPRTQPYLREVASSSSPPPPPPPPLAPQCSSPLQTYTTPAWDESLLHQERLTARRYRKSANTLLATPHGRRHGEFRVQDSCQGVRSFLAPFPVGERRVPGTAFITSIPPLALPPPPQGRLPRLVV